MRLLPAVAGVLIALAASAPAGVEAQQVIASTRDTLLSGPQFDAALLAELNAVRAQHGLPAVVSDPRLAMAARRHSADMAEARAMQHQIAGRPSFQSRVRAAGARVRTAGENILRSNISRFGASCGSRDTAIPADELTRALARDSVRRWLGSPPHRASMLNPQFRRAGGSFAVIAAPDACGQIYVTQVFGG
jgi:uncharacterized protein YkwD